jgi:hypothetical protein
VAQIYPRALGSLSVASYVSQGYGGGILSHLHTGKYFTENETRRICVFVYGIYVAEGAEICFPTGLRHWATRQPIITYVVVGFAENMTWEGRLKEMTRKPGDQASGQCRNVHSLAN